MSRLARTAVLAGVVLALAGCAESAGTSHGAMSMSTPTATASASVPDELTAEQALATDPPPPQRVRVAAGGGAVEVSWSPPPPVAQTHSYSDHVVAYRVYRRTAGEIESTPIGVTTDRAFRDPTARAGATYAYSVSSIRERNVEGSRSDPETIHVPAR